MPFPRIYWVFRANIEVYMITFKPSTMLVIGAKNLVADEDQSLWFTVQLGPHTAYRGRSFKVVIEYARASDTYTVKLIRIERNLTVTDLAVKYDIYADHLDEIVMHICGW